jgi:hypothetical protein
MFFQSAKLDARKDKGFVNLYFPKTTGAHPADCVDGEVRFETEEGTYKLTKAWEKSGGSCSLVLPDRTILRDGEKIQSILQEILQYGRGIYDELVFASQKRQQTVLQAMLQDGKKASVASPARDELTETVTSAVMDSGGVSVDKLEKRLQDIMLQYNERWDDVLNMPEGGAKRGLSNKWSVATKKDENKALILRAYYAMEEVSEARRSALAAEQTVEQLKSRVQSVKEKKDRVTARREDFRKYSAVLQQYASLHSLKQTAEKQMQEMQLAYAQWPVAEQNRRKATELEQRLAQAKCRELYTEVQKLQEKRTAAQNKAAALGEAPTSATVKQTADLERKIQRNEQKLGGLNLSAKLRQLGDTPIEVRSAVDGHILDVGDGAFTITEAVVITVPGVMELQMTPKGCDLEAVQAEAEQDKSALGAIFAQYGVESVDALREKFSAQTELAAEIETLQSRMEVKLNGKDWEELCQENAQVPENIETSADLRVQEIELCGAASLAAFAGKQQGIVEQYQAKYGSLQMLTEAMSAKSKELDGYGQKLDSLDSVPEEYSQIEDADAYDAGLKAEVDTLEQTVEELREELTVAERKLGDKSAEEYAEEYLDKKAAFEETKETYAHWKHIYAVVEQVKETGKSNPMADIEEKFREYLTLLTDGGMAVQTVDEKMDASITSGSHPMTYDILSAGTKDTVYLAFRLAVLEHLYPNGGGLAIFDDPFTDMDPTRTAQACKLLQRFAEKNQIIFVTCDDKYVGLLETEAIEV